MIEIPSRLAKLLRLTRPLIILDYETTGTDPAKARICSIGMRRHKPDGMVQPYKTLVNPLVLMPKSASDTHKITQDVLDTGCAYCWQRAEVHPTTSDTGELCEKFRTIPTFKQLAPRLLPTMNDADFGGFNIRYDLRVAAEEFNREGMTFDYSKAAILDGYRLLQLLDPRTLSDVYEKATGKKLKDAHDAMADVLASEEVIEWELTEHDRCDLFTGKTVDDLHEMQWPADPNRLDADGKFVYADNVLVFSFGKFKGKPVAQNTGYVQWMLGADFPPDVKRWCERILAGQVLLRRIPDADQGNAAQIPAG